MVNNKADLAYAEKKEEALALLAKLAEAIEADDESVTAKHWGHVGSLGHTVELLSEAYESIR